MKIKEIKAIKPAMSKAGIGILICFVLIKTLKSFFTPPSFCQGQTNASQAPSKSEKARVSVP